MSYLQGPQDPEGLSDLPMVAGGHRAERGAQARPLPATCSTQSSTAVEDGVSLKTCSLPDMAKGLLGLDPDIALALEQVVPQDLLLGGREDRLGWRQPMSRACVGEGRGQCHRKEAERLGV